jgi:hypothetical protein
LLNQEPKILLKTIAAEEARRRGCDVSELLVEALIGASGWLTTPPQDGGADAAAAS